MIKFGKRDDVFIVKGGPKKREEIYLDFAKAETGVMIISHTTFGLDATPKYKQVKQRQVRDGLVRFNVNVDYIVLDEAHFLRNNSKKTKFSIIGNSFVSTLIIGGWLAEIWMSEAFLFIASAIISLISLSIKIN